MSTFLLIKLYQIFFHRLQVPLWSESGTRILPGTLKGGAVQHSAECTGHRVSDIHAYYNME